MRKSNKKIVVPCEIIYEKPSKFLAQEKEKSYKEGIQKCLNSLPEGYVISEINWTSRTEWAKKMIEEFSNKKLSEIKQILKELCQKNFIRKQKK